MLLNLKISVYTGIPLFYNAHVIIIDATYLWQMRLDVIAIKKAAKGKHFSSAIIRNNVARTYASTSKAAQINEKQTFPVTTLLVGKSTTQDNTRFLIYELCIQCLVVIRKVNKILSQINSTN